MKTYILIATSCLMLFAGCASKTPIHPGSLSTFDSTAYDTLLTSQAAIEAASTEVVANYPALKLQMNEVRKAYTATQAAYKAYHEAAAAGKPTDPAALDAMLKKLTADIAAIVAKLKPTPTPTLAPNPTGALILTSDWRLA